MASFRAFAAATLALVLSACGAPDTPGPAAPEKSAPAAGSQPAIWFICDGVDAPAIVTARGAPAAGAAVLLTQYDKNTGLPTRRAEYALAEPEGAAGHIEYAMSGEAGEAFVRAVNPGMLEQQGSDFTQPIVGVRIGQDALACRWLPRTRFTGFSERRSWVVHEDGDGDLIYLAYDFLDPHRTDRVDLSDGARTTRFSLEVRGGTETMDGAGAQFRFENGGFLYAVDLPNGSPGTVTVTQNGALIQNETLLAYQLVR